MNWRATSQRYAVISIFMHWLMFLLLVAVYACIELREFFPKGSDPRAALKTWHFMLGLSVFGLVLLRLFIRYVSGSTPKIVPAPAHWQQQLAKASHVLLYALMLTMPVLGYCILSLSGKDIPFFGLNLPSLLAVNVDAAHWVEEIHETVGTAGYYLIGLHTVAALFHHYVLRDNTLKRMSLPFKKQK